MKRYVLFGLVVLVAGTIGGAGYLGMRSTRPASQGPVQVPATVSVTRGDVQQSVTAPGRLVGTRQVMLSLSPGGKLADISVRPGQTVVSGTVVARLDPAPLQEKLETAQADLDLARAKLEKIKAGPSAAELAGARQDLAGAEARLSDLQSGPGQADAVAAQADLTTAQNKLAKLKAGPDQTAVQNARYALEAAKNSLWSAQVARDAICGGPNKVACDQAQASVGNGDVAVRKAQEDLDRILAGPSADDVHQAELDVQKAQARLNQLYSKTSEGDLKAAQLQRERAQAALDQLTAGPNSVDLKQAEATLRSAELSFQKAQRDLQAAELVVPFDGIVLEVKANPGETLAANAPLILLADTRSVEVESTVVEEDLPLVKAGQEVELFFDALPDAAVKGHVARLVPQRASGDRTVFPVYITLDSRPDGLQSGMTADGSIIIARQTGVLRLPRAIVKAGKDGAAQLQVWMGDHAEPRQVMVGLRGDVNVEITEGLREGEQVVGQ